MLILSIDPGPKRSAFVIYDSAAKRLKAFATVANESVEDEDMLGYLNSLVADVCVIEMIASYGMAVGAEVFETCVWIGRFMEAWKRGVSALGLVERITRGEVKTTICRSRKATDANIRQALIDRFGGKDLAIGKKASPGPLYGVSGDVWAALAVAVAVAEEPPF